MAFGQRHVDMVNEALDANEQHRLNNGQTPVSRDDGEFANKTLAYIKRQQWNQYKEKYPAIQAEYLDMTMGQDFTQSQVNRVENNVSNSFARTNANQGATLARMGVQNTAQDDGIDKALATAHGENAIRQHGQDRQLNAVAGGQLPTLQTQTG